MTFEQWEISARIALSDRGIGYHDATPIIDEARAQHTATGEDPLDAFGTPEEFAAAAAEAAPAEVREEVDRHGLTVADHLTGGLFHLAVLTLLGSAFFAVLESTWSFPVTPAVVAGVPLLALGMLAAGSLPNALRAAGRPGWAKFGFVAAGVLAVATATAFMTLPREPVWRVPVLVLIAAAVAAIALLLRGPKERSAEREARTAARKPQTAAGDGQALRADDREAWLTRLTGLLVGRYDLPAGRAAELTREARAHLDATGAAPEDEFGPVAGYARQLAEHEPVRREPWWRRTPATMVSLVLGVYLGVSAFVDWSEDGHEWAAYLVAVPVTAALAWQLVTTARDYLGSRSRAR